MAKDGFEAGGPAELFDLGRLAEISGDDREFEQELAGEYVSQAWTLLEQFAAALERRDGGALRRTSHTLKGSSRTIGAEGVAQLAAQLELQASEPDLLPAKTTLEHARRRLTATERELDRYFGSDGYRRSA